MSKPICGYIKVGDFEGGSADAQHTGWSEIIGLNAAVERKTGSFIKSDNPVGSTSLGDVIVEKLVDAASVKLMKACATGQKIPKVQIQMRHGCRKACRRSGVRTQRRDCVEI